MVIPFLKNLIYFWLCGDSVALHRLSLAVASGGSFLGAVQGLGRSAQAFSSRGERGLLSSCCVWGLGRSAQAFSSRGERSFSLVAVCELPIAVASLVAKHRLWGVWTSVVVVLGSSCPSACGISLDQESNLWPLH